jgi:KDO2-lipid IV(A) lauroyltransferase
MDKRVHPNNRSRRYSLFFACVAVTTTRENNPR